MKKSSLSLFAALVVALLCLCGANNTTAQVVASGTTGACSWQLTGTFPNYTLTISGAGAMGDYNWGSTAPWYSYRSGIKTLDIQQGVTTIGEYAFCDCSGLTSLTIPNSVTSIGNSAFEYCSGLTAVTIPNSVTTIGEYAFCFCSGLTSLTIPNSVTTIGDYAFFGCSGLTSLTIPNSVTTIGSSAFRGCSGLTSLTIPNSVTTIGEYAFSGCSGLTAISVSGTHFKLADNVGVAQVLIPYADNGLNSACSNVVGCLAIGNLTIPNSVTAIGDYAFYGCSGLTSVAIPNSVTTIGEYAFFECFGLTSITIPHSVTTIGMQAFDRCRNVKKLTLGSGVVSIGAYAFSESPLDTLISLAANPPVLDSEDTVFHCSYEGADYGVQNPAIPVYVACNSSTAYRNAPGWSYFTNITEDCSGIEEQTLEPNITLYPNPATDKLTVLLPETAGRALFTLYDMQGKALLRQEVSSGDAVEVRHLAAGIYLYQVAAGAQRYQGKVVKQ